MSKIDGNTPAFTSFKLSPEMLVEYKKWHRKRYSDENRRLARNLTPCEILFLSNGKGGTIDLVLADDERLTLDQWNRLLPEDRQRAKPHQLPEERSS
jgi:hypothetical protein